jgi:hypothetical protein
VLTVGPFALPEPHLFNQGESRFAQFSQLGEGDQCGAEILSFHERRIRFHARMERIFLVEIRKEFLPRLSD